MENEIKSNVTNTNNEAETTKDEAPTITESEANQRCYVARTKAEAKSAKKIAELENKIKDLETKPILEKALKDSGCKDKAIAMILSQNPVLRELVNDQAALTKEIERITTEYDYAFEKKPFTADPLANKQVNEEAQTQEKLTQFSRFFSK